MHATATGRNVVGNGPWTARRFGTARTGAFVHRGGSVRIRKIIWTIADNTTGPAGE